MKWTCDEEMNNGQFPVSFFVEKNVKTSFIWLVVSNIFYFPYYMDQSFPTDFHFFSEG
jgi:hypothetical protein